jgi:hypothetical protein
VILTISEAAGRQAIDEGMAGGSEALARMHVALMHPVGRRKGAHGPLVRVDADPNAWSAFAAWLSGRSTVPPGSTKAAERHADRYARARATIARELTKLAAHPGYRGVAVVGMSRVALPAYRYGDGRWWPTSTMAFRHGDGSTLEHVTLQPEGVEIRKRRYTRWVIPPES